jgi:hypothetical protein
VNTADEFGDRLWFQAAGSVEIPAEPVVKVSTYVVVAGVLLLVTVTPTWLVSF